MAKAGRTRPTRRNPPARLKHGQARSSRSKRCETLVVLGAGASIGSDRYPIRRSLDRTVYRMPSAQHFFYDLFSAERGDRTDIINFLACTYENVHDFITRAWGLSQYPTPRAWRSMNVEDVFSFLDVGERMLRKGTGYHAAFSKSKEYLLDLIWLLLDMKCSGQHCEHLSSVFHDIDPSDSIISYNWDTIADRTLSHFDRPQHKNYVQLMSADHFRLRDYSSKGVLLKLHGSLSWVLCSNRKCPASKKPLLVDAKCEGRLSLNKAYEKCPTCGTPRPKPFIVPPTSSKPSTITLSCTGFGCLPERRWVGLGVWCSSAIRSRRPTTIPSGSSGTCSS